MAPWNGCGRTPPRTALSQMGSPMWALANSRVGSPSALSPFPESSRRHVGFRAWRAPPLVAPSRPPVDRRRSQKPWFTGRYQWRLQADADVACRAKRLPCRVFALPSRAGSRNGYTGTSPKTSVLKEPAFAAREALAGKDARALARELLAMTHPDRDLPPLSPWHTRPAATPLSREHS